MSKVRTFSRHFPSYHPKAGLPTFFVEKILNTLQVRYNNESYFRKLLILNTDNIAKGKLSFEDIESFFISLQQYLSLKPHTIRNGTHFKAGDKFSPRVWFGKPYNSPQIIFLDDIEVKKVWEIEIYENSECYINAKFFGMFGSENWYILAANDGLESKDLVNWILMSPDFKKTQYFQGQIICWNENINY